jgi:hypothetical protein
MAGGREQARGDSLTFEILGKLQQLVALVLKSLLTAKFAS